MLADPAEIEPVSLYALINCISRETALNTINVDAIEIFMGESAEFVFGFKSAYDYLGRRQIVTPDSGYGFLPGEAAALLLVSNSADESVCVLSSVDCAQEEYELFQSELEQDEEPDDESELGAQTFFH